jgi:hypothetical protein
MDTSTLPVVVIGAGPVGLAAAAHLVARDLDFRVLEGGDAVGAHVRAWGHVRVFSPWRYNTDPAAVALLEQTGWSAPDPDGLPTGAELVGRYLAPLAAHPAIAPRLRTGARVVAVARRGYDKLKTEGRAGAPFAMRVETADGEEEILARAVIDASGTYGSANPLGATGVPALGEETAADRITYGIADVLGADRVRYAGQRVLVVGSGHSAMNVLLDLAVLAEQAPGTSITWAIRRRDPGLMFGGGANDALPARGSIGARARALADAGVLTLVTGFATARVSSTADGVLVSDGERQLGPFDRVVAATGFRPDLAPLRELRLALDEVVESPVRLAPLIDPNVHSCGSVPPHGYEELRHPEEGFYMVGAKSYGRAPTVLMRTGYEQARSVVAAIAGDLAAARDVQLILPETGVCSSDPAGAGAGAACCGPAPVPAPSRFESLPLLTVASAPRVLLPIAGGAPTAACCGGECCDGAPAPLADGQTRDCCAGDCCGA